MKPAILLGTLRGSDRLAAGLLGRADVELITLYDAVSEDLARRGIPNQPLNRFLTDDLKEHALREAERRAMTVSQSFFASTLRAYYAHLEEAEWSALRNITLRLLGRDIAEEILLVELIRRCAGQRDLRLIVVQEDYGRDTRTAIQAAHRYGVPALHILHGIPYQTQAGHDVLEADMIAAQGDRARAVCIDEGMAPDRVVVTGNPDWDRYAETAQPAERNRACAKLGLDPARPIVGYAATFTHAFSAASARFPHYHSKTTQAVIDAFVQLQQRHTDWQFVLRPHPGDTRPAEETLQCAREASLVHAALSTNTAYDFLTPLDVLLCTHSNIGVEGLILGVPVINVAIDAIGGPVFEEGYGPLFREDDPVLHARKVEDIAPAVESALLQTTVKEDLSQRRSTVLDEFNFANDGKATERVCNLALDMTHHADRYGRSLDRYPELETAFVEAIPERIERILVVGDSASYTASAVLASYPGMRISTSRELPRNPSEAPSALILADPLPHSAKAEQILASAAQISAPDSHLIAAVWHGGHRDALRHIADGDWAPARRHGLATSPVMEYAMNGLDTVLSRAGWIRLSHLALKNGAMVREGQLDPEVVAFVVVAQRRSETASAFFRDRMERMQQAREANERGEALFAQGDIHGSMQEFARAIGLWRQNAVAHNNFGTALSALGQLEPAYERIREALHFNPNLQTARNNLRLVGAQLGREEEVEHLLALFGEDREPG